MSEPMTMTDIEFLKLPELNQQSHLYLYQENSALLRPAVRTKVAGQALVDGRALRDIATYSQRIQKPRSLGAESEAAGSAHADRDGLSGANQNDALDEATKSVLLPSLSLTVSEVSLFGDTLAVLDLGECRQQERMSEEL